MKTSSGWTVCGILLLCAMAMAVTVAGFYTFIIPGFRSTTFHAVLTFLIFGEVLLSGYLAYVLTIPHTVQRPSAAVRQRSMVLIIVWFLVILALGCAAVRPAMADSFLADSVIFFQLLLTFFLFVSIYFVHRQDVVIQLSREGPEKEREQLLAYAGGIQQLKESLETLRRHRPEHQAEMDRLAKRLDTLKTQLLAAPPPTEREGGRLVPPLPLSEVENRLRAVHAEAERAKQASGEQIGQEIDRLRDTLDGLISAMRQRQDTLTL
jgi:hypothetical protein